MSYIYSTPEQPSQNPEKARLWLVGDARYTIQNALLRQHQLIANDLARQRVMKLQLVEKSTTVPIQSPIETPEAPQQAVPVSSELLPLTAEQLSQEAIRQQLIDDAYRQINEAHAA